MWSMFRGDDFVSMGTNTLSYTFTGLQLTGRVAWGVSVGFLFLVLPLKQALFTEDMFLREQQMQMEERTNQGIGSALGLGGQGMGLDFSNLNMEE